MAKSLTRLTLITALLLGSLPALSLTCKDDLDATFKTLSFEQKLEKIESMKEDEMACLFAYAVVEPVVPIEYFVPSGDRMKLVKFFGKSTQVGGAKFERHMFLAEVSGAPTLLGYDYSRFDKVFGTQGMFKADCGQVPDQLVLDYSHNFKKLLKGLPIPQGAKIKKYRSNEGSATFDGLRDIVRLVNDEVVVGITMKRPNSKAPDSKEEFKSYFVLLREPTHDPAPQPQK